MSGKNRLEHKQKSATLKRDRGWIVLVSALVVLGIAISLVLAHYGWEPSELIGP
jgi:hypothetical protein